MVGPDGGRGRGVEESCGVAPELVLVRPSARQCSDLDLK